MSVLAVGLCGALFGLGVFITVAAWTGRLSPPDRSKLRARLVAVRRAGTRGWAATAAVVAVGGLTRWPAAALIAGAGVWLAPELVAAGRRREEAVRRTEAVAGWAEMLRDTLAGGGLRDAVRATAAVAPGPIRAEVTALGRRAEYSGLSDALKVFAAEVDDPVADSVVAALVVANERQAAGLRDLLGQVAASARESTAMYLRIEAGRARTYTQARMVLGITVVFAAGLAVASPDYMAPSSARCQTRLKPGYLQTWYRCTTSGHGARALTTSTVRGDGQHRHDPEASAAGRPPGRPADGAM